MILYHRNVSEYFFADRETFLTAEPSIRVKGVRRMNEMEVREHFEKIYNNTYDNIYRFLIIKADKRETAEDILQNVYLAFYRKMLTGERVLAPERYLMRMAKHQLADYYSERRKCESLDSGTEIIDEKALEQLQNDDSYTYEEIMQHIKNIDELTYKIFLLHFGYDFTIGKTAKMLGLGESTVKSKMYRALKKLRNGTKESGEYALPGRR